MAKKVQLDTIINTTFQSDIATQIIVVNLNRLEIRFPALDVMRLENIIFRTVDTLEDAQLMFLFKKGK